MRHYASPWCAAFIPGPAPSRSARPHSEQSATDTAQTDQEHQIGMHTRRGDSAEQILLPSQLFALTGVLTSERQCATLGVLFPAQVAMWHSPIDHIHVQGG